MSLFFSVLHATNGFDGSQGVAPTGAIARAFVECMRATAGAAARGEADTGAGADVAATAAVASVSAEQGTYGLYGQGVGGAAASVGAGVGAGVGGVCGTVAWRACCSASRRSRRANLA